MGFIKGLPFKAKKLLIALDKQLEDGGPGSGNFGHKGRPGQVGGSGKGGGEGLRTGSAETGYSGVQKAKKFQSLAATARGSKDYTSFSRGIDRDQKRLIEEQHKACGTPESLDTYTERLFGVLRSTPKPKRQENKPVDGRDISMEYTYDGPRGEIDTRLEDVIQKQGFDGAPKVVSMEEFKSLLGNMYIRQHILLRTYTAPNEETLRDFDEQLNGGEWYVDCKHGASAYGLGMYCQQAQCYEMSTVNSGVEHAMQKIQMFQGMNRDQGFSGSIRIMSLQPGSRTTSYEDAKRMYEGALPDEEKWAFYNRELESQVEQMRKDGVPECDIVLFREYWYMSPLLSNGRPSLEETEAAREQSKDPGWAEQKVRSLLEPIQAKRARIEEERKKAFAERFDGDVNACAAALGYDAVYVDRTQRWGWGYGDGDEVVDEDVITVVLNRSKLIIAEERFTEEVKLV